MSKSVVSVLILILWGKYFCGARPFDSLGSIKITGYPSRSEGLSQGRNPIKTIF
jgi:hypothetical protein